MITIAIPFYNGQEYLELAIKSVLAQTYQDWELLLIDDGSKDSSLQIAKKYESIDKRIRVYSDGENRNLAYRLNQVPTLVQTKYLARMDADDLMHPERIKSQLKILEGQPEIDVLGTNAYLINEYNAVIGIRVKTELKKPELITCKTFIHPTIMAKTKWFHDNPYDVKAVRVEDADLWRRTYDKNTFKFYNQPLLFYREFGTDYYKKYNKGMKGNFYMFNKNRNYKSIKSLVLYLGRVIVYNLYSFFNIEERLIKRRAVSIDNLEIPQQTLNRVIKYNHEKAI